MREFVQNRDDATLAHGIRHFASKDVGLGKGHAASVLHGSRVELGHKELIVFFEGIRHVELGFIEGKALTRFFKDVVGVEVFGQRGAAENAQGDSASTRAGELAAHNRVGASHERGDV